MPGRTRPIEKFAEATAKCSPEVCFTSFGGIIEITDMALGRCIRQMHRGQLPERPQRHVCQGVHAAEGLLSCTQKGSTYTIGQC